MRNSMKIICVIMIISVFVLFIFKKVGSINFNEENTEDYQYLKNYKSNECVPLYITEEDVVKKYLNEYKNNMLYDIDEAYNSLNNSYRVKRFKNIDGYKEYVNNKISNSTYSMEIEKYSVSNINGYKVFNIYDKSGNQYIIKEISIMNYEIYLDENTVVIE